MRPTTSHESNPKNDIADMLFFPKTVWRFALNFPRNASATVPQTLLQQLPLLRQKHVKCPHSASPLKHYSFYYYYYYYYYTCYYYYYYYYYY